MNPERITLHTFSCSLISGDVEGNIKAFFGKVQGVLTKSGPFDVRHQTFMYEARCESNPDSVPLRQMLLCVGSFFANTSACREEWARYVDGKEQGTYVYRMVTSKAHIVFIVSVIYGVPYTYFLLYTVPLATYILGPTSSEQVPFYGGLGLDGGELCPNLTCLGTVRGVLQGDNLDPLH